MKVVATYPLISLLKPSRTRTLLCRRSGGHNEPRDGISFPDASFQQQRGPSSLLLSFFSLSLSVSPGETLSFIPNEHKIPRPYLGHARILQWRRKRPEFNPRLVQLVPRTPSSVLILPDQLRDNKRMTWPGASRFCVRLDWPDV